MTESLIADLRSAADRMRGWTYSGDADPDPRGLMRDAASEIERLEARIKRAERDRFVKYGD